MILVTVGSQKFQFNRLLQEVDNLIDEKRITDKVFAQIGSSDYIPRKYEYIDFMSQDEFNRKLDECDVIITHAGTGVIINSLKKGKKVLAIPRIAKYGEHVDDHQIQLVDEFAMLNFVEPVYDVKELGKKIGIAKAKKYSKYKSNADEIIKNIESFIG